MGQPMERSDVSGPSKGSLAAPAPPSQGKMDAVQVISSEGHNFMIDVEESSTVFNLKESIDEEIGVGTSRQDIFFLGYPLTDDDALLKDFTKFSSSFTVVVPAQGKEKDLSGKKPREFFSYREVFLITGERQNFQAILLDAYSEERIRLKSKKFGVVKHIEGKDELGKRIFHFRVYEVKREGSICLRHEDGRDKVYLITEEGPNGEEVELRPVDLQTYDERKYISSLDKAGKRANAICPWLSALGDLLAGGGAFA